MTTICCTQAEVYALWDMHASVYILPLPLSRWVHMWMISAYIMLPNAVLTSHLATCYSHLLEFIYDLVLNPSAQLSNDNLPHSALKFHIYPYCTCEVGGSLSVMVAGCREVHELREVKQLAQVQNTSQ